VDAVCSNGLASSLGPRPAYGKLGEGLDCKRREAGRGPGLQATGSWARAWERGFEGEIRLKHARNCDLSCTAVLCHYHARV